MKYLKTFENYSINEEEGFLDKAKKFVTGHEDDKAKEKAKEEFIKALDEAEELVSKNPESYAFNRSFLEKRAKENNYKGGLRIQRGGRDSSRFYVVYDLGTTGLEKIAGAAAYKVANP